MTKLTMDDIRDYLEYGVQPSHDLRGVVRHTAAYKGWQVTGLVRTMPALAGGVPVSCDEEVMKLTQDLTVLGIQINTPEELAIIREQVLSTDEFTAYASRCYQFNPFTERHDARRALYTLVEKVLGRDLPIGEGIAY